MTKEFQVYAHGNSSTKWLRKRFLPKILDGTNSPGSDEPYNLGGLLNKYISEKDLPVVPMQ